MQFFSGETSSGKSTLMNKILEKKIFKSRNEESTSTICKIRNSDRTKVIIVNEDSERTEKDLTGECDTTTKEGVRKLRKLLKGFTDITCSTQSIAFKSVEITFPIPILKVELSFSNNIFIAIKNSTFLFPCFFFFFL